MKRSILLFLIILASFSAQGQSISRIGVVNPTPSNLRNVLNLIEREHLQADSIAIVGLYHNLQASSIKQSEEFIKNSNFKNITLRIIDAPIPIDSLFVENSWSADFKDILDDTDALLIFGGADIPPHIYGEESFITTELISAGKNWELSFLFHLIGGSQNPDFEALLNKRPDYPILGVCLGMQELNVASGGSMYQDIPFQVYGLTTHEQIQRQLIENRHKNYYDRIDNEKDYTYIHFHPITIVEDSFLAFPGMTAAPTIASVHHQAVKKIGEGFRVAATSIDEKIVEALQHEVFKNVYGVQFHPDFSVLYEEGKEFLLSPDQKWIIDESTRLFHRLIWENFSKRVAESK